MHYQQKKKLKSPEKERHFRKTSPNSRNNNTMDIKNYKRTLEIQAQNSKQLIDHQNHSKHFSFLRFIPLSAKNITQKNQEVYQNSKQIKIPSFFKKSIQNNQSLHTFNSNNVVELNLQKSEERIQKGNTIQRLNQIKSLDSSRQSNNETQNSSLSNGQLTEYKKLNDKINYLQNKILNMKTILQKKRQEKLDFMQFQKTERASIIFSDQDTSDCSSSQTPLRQFVTQVPQHRDLHAFSQNPYSPRHSLYYVSQILRAYKQDKSLARQHIISSIEYIRMFQYTKVPDQQAITHLKVNLPRLKGFQDKKTVIFDLDQTLIHCNQNVKMPSDLKIKINFPTGQLIQVGINIRPYAKQILAALSKKFEIIVFTASHSCYANVVLDHLDPQNKHIHHRLFRQSCYLTQEGVYVKDLRILNRHLSKVILVDNAAYSYAYQPLNGVPIIPYYEGKNDYQLAALQKYIQSLMFSYDVREKNKNTFKIDRYSEFEELNSLVQTLYKPLH